MYYAQKMSVWHNDDVLRLIFIRKLALLAALDLEKNKIINFAI